MKATQFLITTLKEAPADAEVVSHQLMVRAGLIRRLSAGIYNYLPMGLRVIRKVEHIVREEMNRAGAIELTMPLIQPAELWQETGRFASMGPELLRIEDRHARSFVVQPTSEEVITDLARHELKSYKQLPKNLYQIQTKFRDERRPRFGLMRGREFIMKDAYSFDRSAEEAAVSYEKMSRAYRAIFDRFGLKYRAVAADSGAIGGDLSQEFQVVAATGEDAIVYCPKSDYAANMEKAQAAAPAPRPAPTQAMRTVATPGMTSCEAVAAHLGVPLSRTVKSIVLATDTPSTRIWLLLIRGDHSLNEVKVGKLAVFQTETASASPAPFRFASESEILAHFACQPGYLGPVQVAHSIAIIADPEVAALSDWICGANQADAHLQGVNWERDLPKPHVVADIRNVVAGDPSPCGGGPLAIERGIEVGHIFYLGTQYAKAMNATFLDVDGKPKPFEMGCYGIGITRLPAAAIEQNHDERGIIWPEAIAPFTVVICPIGFGKSQAVRQAAEQLYRQWCAQGVDVILDDRDERPGVMFADWELIGVPHRITLGERSLQQGLVTYQCRADASNTAHDVAISHIVDFVCAKLG